MSPHVRQRPPPPDPGKEVASFLAWLKKLNSAVELSRCDAECTRRGLDIHKILKDCGNERIAKGLLPKRGKTIKVVVLYDLKWADAWSIFYDVEIPHHRHGKKL